MIFRQHFDPVSFTYTYVIAEKKGGEALIIDPVFERIPYYLRVITDLDLQLVVAVDTHTHADHITGLGELREATDCAAVMGSHSRAECLSYKVREGERLKVNNLALDVLYTPGHTDDSYSFLLADRVFTGDTLLIGATGRTDLQNGDPRAQYDSLFNKLLRLPEDTLVYPAHDYNGCTASTIGEERRLNPRLQVHCVDEYVALMNGLQFNHPTLMNDDAVAANLGCGKRAA